MALSAKQSSVTIRRREGAAPVEGVAAGQHIPYVDPSGIRPLGKPREEICLQDVASFI